VTPLPDLRGVCIAPNLDHGVAGPHDAGVREMPAALGERRVEFTRRNHFLLPWGGPRTLIAVPHFTYSRP
jgi:hypothetical protein